MLLLTARSPAAQPIFEIPQNVSQSADNSRQASIVRQGIDPATEILRVFWHDFSGATNQLWCSENDGSGWTAGAVCEPNTDQAWGPRAIRGAGGSVQLFWRGRVGGVDDIYHAVHDGTGWSAPVDVSNTAEGSSNPSAAYSGDGLMVLWEQQVGADTRFYQAIHDGAAWGPAQDTGLPYAGARIDTIRVTAGSSGLVHAVWQDLAGAFYEILYSERPAGGSWSPPESVSRSPFEDSVEPAIVGYRGYVHVAWVEQDPLDGLIWEVAHARREWPGVWEPPRNVSNQRGNAFRPVIAGEGCGTARIAWRGATPGGSDVFYYQTQSRSPQDVSQTPGNSSWTPSILARSDRSACLAWEEEVTPGNFDILVSCSCAPFDTGCCEGVDRDCDGLAGMDDTDCWTEECYDGIDNDCDGDIDLSDADCSGAPDCPPIEWNCTDGRDDDGNGLVDCDDPDCAMDPSCFELNCANGLDDDGDGFVDCEDQDCVRSPLCAREDFDGDGIANLDDCAPTDPGAFAVPEAVYRIEVARGPGGVAELSWTAIPDAGSGTGYEVAGAALEQLRLDGAASAPCLVMGLSATDWTDASAPGRESRYYIVRAANACGPGPGAGWGLDSRGVERPACP